MSDDPYLWLLREFLHQCPSLLARPRQVLGILEVLAEGVLPDLADAPGNDVLGGILHALTVANFVDELQYLSAEFTAW